MNAAKKNIDDSFKKAIKEEKHNYEIINDEFVDDSKSLLVEWGCNEECVHKLNISLSSKMKTYSGIEKCDCPLGVKYYVSTPLGPETLNNDLQVNPVILSNTIGGDDKSKTKDNTKDTNKDKSKDDNKDKTKDDNKDKTKDDKNKDDKNKASDNDHTVNSKTNEHPKVQSNKGSLKIKFDTGGYIFIVCMVFVGQIVIVLWIKFIYLKRRAKRSDKRFYERADKF